jgi:hypothetical protein
LGNCDAYCRSGWNPNGDRIGQFDTVRDDDTHWVYNCDDDCHGNCYIYGYRHAGGIEHAQYDGITHEYPNRDVHTMAATSRASTGASSKHVLVLR